ncbi:MAG: hypothetical protein OXT65_00920 [Alphaproteobacteria bacterium]|nr:hypothetical protein [Alphaproteobacteria bacterium]
MVEQDFPPVVLCQKGETVTDAIIRGDNESLQAYISRLKSRYTSQFKYRIAGRSDDMFGKIGRLTSDTRTFSLLKSRRVNEYHKLQQIDASSLDDNQKLVEKAKEKYTFLRMAANALQKGQHVRGARPLTDAVEDVAEQLEIILDEYIQGRTAQGGIDESDREFLTSIRNLEKKLDRIADFQRPRLRAQRRFFEIELYKAEGHFDSITEKLSGLNIIV